MFQQLSQADMDALLEQMRAENERAIAQLPTAEESERLFAEWVAAKPPLDLSEVAAPPPASRRGRFLPQTIRQQIASLRRSGATLREIAATANVSINTVRKYSSAEVQP